MAPNETIAVTSNRRSIAITMALRLANTQRRTRAGSADQVVQVTGWSRDTYTDLGHDHYASRLDTDRSRTRNLRRQLESLGDTVTSSPQPDQPRITPV